MYRKAIFLLNVDINLTRFDISGIRGNRSLFQQRYESILQFKLTL